MRIVATLALTLFTGCASLPNSAKTPAAPFITLEQEATNGHWRATWHLDRPTRALQFERETPFRAELFEVVTPGFSVRREGEFEVLRTGGSPAQEITVRFPELTQKLEKEYDFFQKFSDGSAAIYTGHLNARPLYENGADDCAGAAEAGTRGPEAPAPRDCFIRSFRFVAPHGVNIVAGGRLTRSPSLWNDKEGQGTYVYFGSIAPVESKEMISIVDPAVPAWLQDDVKRALPQLFALYTERFGAKLPERPTILLNYTDSGSTGYSSGGGTLPAQIQLTVDGAAWKERSPEASRNLFHFLSHESVHLWNGQVIHYDGNDDAWMHEGSADALAQRTLLELGMIDREGFLDYQTSALNECRSKLAAFPLRDAAKRRATQLYYSCGNSLALFTEASMKDGDLFTFWNRLIRRVVDSGRTAYDADDYVAVWKESGASAEDIARMQRFISSAADADALVASLNAKGIITTEESNPPESYGQQLSRDALLKLLKEHCTGPLGFNVTESGFALSSTNNCGPIPAGVVLKAMGGHSVLRSGERVWDALHESCGTASPVVLNVSAEGSDRDITVPCRNGVAKRIPYLRITREGKAGASPPRR